MPFIIFTLIGCNTSSHTKVKDDCIEISKQFPSSVHLSGNIVIIGKNDYLYNGQNQAKQPLSVENNINDVLLSNFKISPDHKKMIYEERHYDQSGLINKYFMLFQDNRTPQVVNIQSDYGTLIHWFDEDRLLFVPESQPQGTIILLNPQTMQVEQIVGSFPDMYTLAPLPSWYGSFNPRPIYDPSLSLALYLHQGDGMEYVLWDTKSKSPLWEKHVADPSSEPQWSPTGDQIVFAIPQAQSGFEFFGVNKDGTEKQLTDLSSLYNSVYIGPFSWSPDGHYIAFWLDAENDDDDFDPKLALLDIKRNEIVNYCLGEGGMKPVWSPDGRQIAIKIRQSTSDPTITVIVDLDTKSAILIDENVYPAGWLR